MPAHDWTQVEAGLFHAVHLSWMGELQRELNSGLLPEGFYAIAEQLAGGWQPEVIPLKGPAVGGQLLEFSRIAVA